VVDFASAGRDDFPEIEGPPGTKGNSKLQTPVLKGLQLTGENDDILKVWYKDRGRCSGSNTTQLPKS
jgi:hypothetical protein